MLSISRVITTASPIHHDFLRSLGADAVFDYHDSDVVDQIKAGGANIHYALDTVGNEQTFQSVYDATADIKDATIDNLLILTPDKIKTVESRKVSFPTTVVNTIGGEDFNT